MNQYANDFTDTVRMYYDDLKNTKPMPRAKEKRLLRQCRQGNIKARNEILESNLKFVFDMAKRYTGRGVPISDLISEGNMGLIYAIDKFDENKDVKFISYAVWWVRHYMIDAIKRKKLKSSIETFENEAFNENYENIGIDDDEDEDIVNSDVIFSDLSDKKMSEIHDMQVSAVENIMSTLTSREELVIDYYYGLNGKEKLNLIEIGSKMGISSERARQIKNQSIKKMRSNALLLPDCQYLY